MLLHINLYKPLAWPVMAASKKTQQSTCMCSLCWLWAKNHKQLSMCMACCCGWKKQKKKKPSHTGWLLFCFVLFCFVFLLVAMTHRCTACLCFFACGHGPWQEAATQDDYCFALFFLSCCGSHNRPNQLIVFLCVCGHKHRLIVVFSCSILLFSPLAKTHHPTHRLIVLFPSSCRHDRLQRLIVLLCLRLQQAAQFDCFFFSLVATTGHCTGWVFFSCLWPCAMTRGCHTGWLFFCFAVFSCSHRLIVVVFLFVCLWPWAQVDCCFPHSWQGCCFSLFDLPPDSPVDCFFLADTTGHKGWLFVFSLWPWEATQFENITLLLIVLS